MSLKSDRFANMNDTVKYHATDTIVDRLRYLVKMSKMTQARFAEQIGIDPSNLSKHLSGKSPVSESLINRIVVEMGVSKQWLRDGTDLPFGNRTMARNIEVAMPLSLSAPASAGTPVYDIDVTAGRGDISRLFTRERLVGAVTLPGLSSGSSIVHVTGNSMSPVINDGGYIAIHQLHNMRNIFWGQIYVIVMEEYRMVKYLRRHPDPEMVILHSANPDYDDMEVDRRDIYSLFFVDAILNFESR